MCQIISERVPVQEPKRVSQPTRVRVLAATGVSALYCPVSPIKLMALKAKDGTCGVKERETERKGHNASGKAGQDWLIAGALCCRRD